MEPLLCLDHCDTDCACLRRARLRKEWIQSRQNFVCLKERDVVNRERAPSFANKPRLSNSLFRAHLRNLGEFEAFLRFWAKNEE